MGIMLLQIAPWFKTCLVVIVLLLALIQIVRLGPPRHRRGGSGDWGPLIGEIGRVLTPLRPIGTCEFDGRRVECTAEGEYIEPGQTVTVIRTEGMQPTVRATERT